MKIAVLSTQAEQLALNNIAPFMGENSKFFLASQIEKIAEYNADVLYLGGMYVTEFSDWQLYRAIIGDHKKVIVHWYGSDVLQAKFFHERGERELFEWLKSDKFVHVSPNGPIKGEIESELGIPTTEPLNVPAEKVYGDIPLPEEFKFGVYLPPGRMDFFNLKLMSEALSKFDHPPVTFYHWLPLLEKIDFEGPHRLAYGLSRPEYEKVLAESSCLIRMPFHDANSISAAEFLMSGRPVVSNNDYPMWPKMLNEQMDVDQIADVFKAAVETPPIVPENVRNFYRSAYDPAKFKERLADRVREKWAGFSW